MSGASKRCLYLKENVQVEPLVDQWYAWMHLIPPATAARNITERHMKIMDSYINSPQVHANFALFPLVGDGAGVEYMLLDEALERGLARVTEVSAEGRVLELAFENASGEKILLVDGDELVGAKQNRILNLTILVGAGRRVVIPVSCVEQGRWHYATDDFRAARRSSVA